MKRCVIVGPAVLGLVWSKTGVEDSTNWLRAMAAKEAEYALHLRQCETASRLHIVAGVHLTWIRTKKLSIDRMKWLVHAMFEVCNHHVKLRA